MVHKCCIKGCKSVWSPKGSITFHGFPSDLYKRMEWLKAVKLKKKYYTGAKICSKHFKPNDYDHTHRRLRLWAVPFGDQSMATETVFLQMPSSSEMENYSDEEDEEVKDKKTRSKRATQGDVTFEETVGMSPPLNMKNSSDEDELISQMKSRLTETGQDTNVENNSEYASPKENILEPGPKRKSLLMEMLTAPTMKPFFENDSVISKVFQDKYDKMTEAQDSDDEVIMAHRSIQVRIATPRELKLRKRYKVLAQKVGRQTKTIQAMKSLIAQLKINTRKKMKEKNMIVCPGNVEDVSNWINKVFNKNSEIILCLLYYFAFICSRVWVEVYLCIDFVASHGSRENWEEQIYC